MKTILTIQAKRAAFAIAIVVAITSGFALHARYVQGKGAIIPAAGTTPVVGATLTLTRVQGSSTFGSTTTTTDAHGNFTFSNLEHGTFDLTITPPPLYSVSGKATPVAPYQAWINFSQCRGLLVGGMNATPGPTGPIAVMTNGTLRLSLSFGANVTATMTR